MGSKNKFYSPKPKRRRGSDKSRTTKRKQRRTHHVSKSPYTKGRDRSTVKQRSKQSDLHECDCYYFTYHQGSGPKPRYPKDLKTVTKGDYDRIIGWPNPNPKPNEFAPKGEYKKSKGLPDGYDTIYFKDYKARTPGRRTGYGVDYHKVTTGPFSSDAPFVPDTAYGDFSELAGKDPTWTAMRRKRRKAKPISPFNDITIYEKDYTPKKAPREGRDEFKVNKDFCGGSSIYPAQAPVEGPTIYREDYTKKPIPVDDLPRRDEFNNTAWKPLGEVPDRTTYKTDYYPKRVKDGHCDVKYMHEIPLNPVKSGKRMWFNAGCVERKRDRSAYTPSRTSKSSRYKEGSRGSGAAYSKSKRSSDRYEDERRYGGRSERKRNNITVEIRDVRECY